MKATVEAWFAEAKKAAWANSVDVKKSCAIASIVTASRIVFNIKSNDRQLTVEVNFLKGIVWIIWIGTHHAYDNIDAAGVKYDG